MTIVISLHDGLFIPPSLESCDYDHVCPGYVYWGPITQAHDFSRECRLVPMAGLGRGKRAALERIANGVGVIRPNGWWNGQNWVVEVLERAVEHDLISPEERHNAIYTAAEPTTAPPAPP